MIDAPKRVFIPIRVVPRELSLSSLTGMYETEAFYFASGAFTAGYCYQRMKINSWPIKETGQHQEIKFKTGKGVNYEDRIFDPGLP